MLNYRTRTDTAMTLLTDIKDAQLVARKAHNEVATSVLTTLYSEASMVGRTLSRPTSLLMQR